MSFFAFPVNRNDDGDATAYQERKMTYRSPSSASSSSRSSSSTTSSSFSNSSAASSSTQRDCWHQSINIREIYKTGKLKLLSERKGIFKKQDKFHEQVFWCVFCIHEESHPFLELYEDHKSSLTHKPHRVISLIHCQHVTPNINFAQHFHSFTLTLASDIHQFSAESDSEMRDWITILRTKILDLQALSDDKHEYTRCPIVLHADEPSMETVSPMSEIGSTESSRESLPAVRLPPPELPQPAIQNRPKIEKRPSPLSSLPKLPITETPLSSPPACLAPPVPAAPMASLTPAPPPIPPRGVKLMRPAPHPLSNCQIPPPPPPRLNDAGKPPKHPAVRSSAKQRTDDIRGEENKLINLDDEGGNVYGTLFVKKRCEVLPDFKRETRSATASPTFSERSVSSTMSEPTSPHQNHHDDKVKSKAATTQTLRQQQVDRLKQEMNDPHGVQVRIRRSHCIDSIALVDCFGCVWIAGWKQDEHPYLHSVLHLGDQVLSVNGIFISKASDVHRILKDTLANKYVVFNLNRVPRGKVLVLTRQFEGQDLGFRREECGAEIRQVHSDGLAAASGLPAKALTCDGNNLCNWVLTEINHRPLNWFFKENEIDDRLKAVGKEISILVQPSDLVNAIKKQLKTIRNYKDFAVQ